MAAPIGNQFWKFRSKHGRDTLFASPELLWEESCKYFQWIDDNPDYKAEAKVVSNGGGEGSSVEIINVPVRKPYTLEGLCFFLNTHTAYFRQFDPPTEDFSTVIKKIREVIENQQFSGAANGFFNANIIARKLGLSESSNSTIKAEVSGSLIPAIQNAQSLDDLDKLSDKIRKRDTQAD